jgi:hypothetical protein
VHAICHRAEDTGTASALSQGPMPAEGVALGRME